MSQLHTAFGIYQYMSKRVEEWITDRRDPEQRTLPSMKSTVRSQNDFFFAIPIKEKRLCGASEGKFFTIQSFLCLVQINYSISFKTLVVLAKSGIFLSKR